MFGAIAQLVEQRTENPCVPGSIPGGTTLLKLSFLKRVFCISTIFFLCQIVQGNMFTNTKNCFQRIYFVTGTPKTI